jgi:hypothetical protein
MALSHLQLFLVAAVFAVGLASAQPGGGYYRGQAPSLTDLSIADLVMMIGNNLPTTLIIGFGLYKVWEKVSSTLSLIEAVSQGKPIPSSAVSPQLAQREANLVSAAVRDTLLAMGWKASQ